MKFKMPARTTIKGRVTTIRNSAFNGILPVEKPDKEDIAFIEEKIGTDKSKSAFLCGYCGKSISSQKDHINPLIIDGKPSGYIHEISNLIPSCESCNSIKSNDTLEQFFDNPKFTCKLSESELIDRKRIVEEYQEYFRKKYGKLVKLNFEQIVDSDLWEEYLNKTEEILELMRSTSDMYNKIKAELSTYYSANKESLKADNF